jgi:hypothetical protein
MAAVFWDRTGKECWWWNSCNKGPQWYQKRIAKHWKQLHRAIQEKRCGMLISGVVLLHDSVHPHTAACTWALLEHFSWKMLEHCWSISAGSCLTTLLIALILLWATITCLLIWRTDWDQSSSTIMMSWSKVSKHGWAHRRYFSYCLLTAQYRWLLE